MGETAHDRFRETGYVIAENVVSRTVVDSLRPEFSGAAGERRFSADGGLGVLIEAGPLQAIAEAHLGQGARPVRLILFDKSAGANWALGWHQDRVIAVRDRIETPGFRNWSRKWGAHHVEPPFEIMERMITIRLHCDDCGRENGALEVVEGSHRLGRLSDAETRDASGQGSLALECRTGDAVILSTSILHRSRAAAAASRRRVVHVDYAAFDLPAPLDWAYRPGSGSLH